MSYRFPFVSLHSGTHRSHELPFLFCFYSFGGSSPLWVTVSLLFLFIRVLIATMSYRFPLISLHLGAHRHYELPFPINFSSFGCSSPLWVTVSLLFLFIRVLIATMSYRFSFISLHLGAHRSHELPFLFYFTSFGCSSPLWVTVSLLFLFIRVLITPMSYRFPFVSLDLGAHHLYFAY